MDNNKEPQIKISDPFLDSVKAVQGEIGELKKLFSWGMTFIIGILLIGFLTLLFMVATMLINAWQFNSNINKENKVIELNSKVVQSNSDQQQDIIKRLDKIQMILK